MVLLLPMSSAAPHTLGLFTPILMAKHKQQTNSYFFRYTGFSPSTTPVVQRQWKDYNPILSVTDAMMTCNGGTSTALSANATAGSTITAKWAQWTHQ